MDLLRQAEQQLVEGEAIVAAAREKYSAAVLAEAEAQVELQVAEEVVARIRRVGMILRGDEPINVGDSKEAVVAQDAPPAPTPKREKPSGPPCSSCGAVGSMRQEVIEVGEKQIQALVCGECHTQRF